MKICLSYRRRLPPHQGWFKKKPPVGKGKSKAAQAKTRFFELYPAEIRYFAKQDKTTGIGSDQKGSIRIGASTTVVTQDESLIITNPDRVWHLTAADGEAQAGLWGSMISEQLEKLKAAPSAAPTEAMAELAVDSKPPPAGEDWGFGNDSDDGDDDSNDNDYGDDELATGPRDNGAGFNIGGKVVMEFDFEADGESELTAMKGSVCTLLSLTDKDGDADWVLVRDDESCEGYVPRNYIGPHHS